MDGAAPKRVSSELAGNVAYAAGHLLFGRDRSLWAQPFNPERLELSGTAGSIAEQELEEHRGLSHLHFSVSENGVLVYQSLADSTSKMMWFDAAGKELSQISELGYQDPRLSPDGRFLAVASDDGRNGRRFIRVHDLTRGVATRLGDEGAEETPAWSPDGRRITYATFDGKHGYIKEVPVDGSGPAKVLVTGATMRHLDWSRDGHLVFSDFSRGMPSLRVYWTATGQVTTFGSAVSTEARFSPDGKWIAYTSFPYITVQAFPGPGGRIQITNAGGAQPAWARDGRRIFYIAPDRKLMAVSFDPEKKTAGVPQVLFQTRIIAPDICNTQYDVAADGRFLINSVPSNYSSPLTLVTGWTAQLGK